MSARISNEELTQIRERAEKATVGEWETADTTDGAWLVDDGGNIIAGTFERIEDAMFSAHARQDIPKLLAEIKRLYRGIEFIANVDMVKNAYDVAHVEASIQAWALNVLKGVNHND